jgi:hypothetical protein
MLMVASTEGLGLNILQFAQLAARTMRRLRPYRAFSLAAAKKWSTRHVMSSQDHSED